MRCKFNQLPAVANIKVVKKGIDGLILHCVVTNSHLDARTRKKLFQKEML